MGIISQVPYIITHFFSFYKKKFSTNLKAGGPGLPADYICSFAKGLICGRFLHKLNIKGHIRPSAFNKTLYGDLDSGAVLE